MRIVTSLTITVLIALSAQARAASSCKECSDQRHACTGGYYAKTCQTDYDRCMKNCQRK